MALFIKCAFLYVSETTIQVCFPRDTLAKRQTRETQKNSQLLTLLKTSEGGMSAERFWHELFFLSYEFSYENAPKFSPKLLSLYFVGEKNPANSRQISR